MDKHNLTLSTDDFHDDAVIEGPNGPYVPLAVVNKLISEKLSALPEVRYPDMSGDSWFEAEGCNPDFPYHKTARLVCVAQVARRK